MKKTQEIITKISQLTLDIETNYPELYRTLDENPMTIPSLEHPQLDTVVMQAYLDSLQQLLEHHKDTHRQP